MQRNRNSGVHWDSLLFQLALSIKHTSPYAAFSMFYLEKLETFKERSTKGMLERALTEMRYEKETM